jgi:hypothetical protein
MPLAFGLIAYCYLARAVARALKDGA